MVRQGLLRPLEKGLRFYAGLALAVVLFQLVGLGMYYVNVWPGVRDNFSTGITLFLGLSLVLGFARSGLWIRIYATGARVFSLLRQHDEPPEPTHRLAPTLSSLTRMLILSSVLDVLFHPVLFLSDAFLPFSLSGWRLGLLNLAVLLFPQAFGLAALILAFITHGYGQLLREQSEMRRELELTI